MKVTLWSVLGGKVSGYLIFSVPPTTTVGALLQSFCKEKGSACGHGYVIRCRDNLALNPQKTLKQSKIQDGDILTLGLSDEDVQTFGFGSWGVVAVAAFIIGIVGIILTVIFFLVPTNQPQQYGIVIDAGSSHSEVVLLRWEDDMVVKVNSCSLTGGISSFRSHPEDLGSYLKACLSSVLCPECWEDINKQKTPLYLGATAGMRILRDFDAEGADLILQSIQDYLTTNTSFPVSKDQVKIITGQEEGISGWISANFLIPNHTQVDSTISTLDVGGASLQVTTELQMPTNWSVTQFHNKQQTYWVHSQSFLCYGIGEARHRYYHFLIPENVSRINDEAFLKEIPIPIEVIDPCVPKGMVQTLPYNEVFSPCTLRKGDYASPSSLHQGKSKNALKKYKLKRSVDISNKENSIENINLSENKDKPGIQYHIRGGSDSGQCGQLVSQLFQEDVCQNNFAYGDCMGNTSLPRITGKLVGFSEVLVDIFHILGENLTLIEIEEEVLKICSMNISQLQNRYPDLPDDDLENFCFDAMYINKLLVDGIGITNINWNDVEFKSEIAGTDIQWSLGYFRSLVTSSASSAPLLGLVPTILLIILFCAFLLSGASFGRHALKISRHSSEYQRCEYPQI